MVGRALAALDLAPLDLVVVENVGNLVCPAEFDVGEHAKAMVYSVTEGEDKPLKYPVMFRAVDVVALRRDRPDPASRRRRGHVPDKHPGGQPGCDRASGQRPYRCRYGRVVRLAAPVHRPD